MLLLELAQRKMANWDYFIMENLKQLRRLNKEVTACQGNKSTSTSHISPLFKNLLYGHPKEISANERKKQNIDSNVSKLVWKFNKIVITRFHGSWNSAELKYKTTVEVKYTLYIFQSRIVIPIKFGDYKWVCLHLL